MKLLVTLISAVLVSLASGAVLAAMGVPFAQGSLFTLAGVLVGLGLGWRKIRQYEQAERLENGR